MSNKRLRKILAGAKQRCYNQNNPAYENYGGRGIEICSHWLASTDGFIEWALENGYHESLSLDRIDNNGDYGPDNCRWADSSTQAANKRKAFYAHNEAEFMFQLEEKIRADLMREVRAVVRSELMRELFPTDLQLKSPKQLKIDARNRLLYARHFSGATIVALAAECEVSERTMRRWIAEGKALEINASPLTQKQNNSRLNAAEARINTSQTR